MDVHRPSVRSKNMRAIRNRDTKPEMFIRRALHAIGFRFRLNVAALPGTPDLLFPKYRAVIFVHGCFWHGHHCHMFKVPETRKEFWVKKIENNILRDAVTRQQLLDAGWRVAIVWECALRGKHRMTADTLISSLTAWLTDITNESAEFAGNDIRA
jgi:DNA mismatch endonuclease, patch repair protein